MNKRFFDRLVVVFIAFVAGLACHEYWGWPSAFMGTGGIVLIDLWVTTMARDCP